jgi:hypothetical protein
MELSRYTGWFHDGSLRGIYHDLEQQKISIAMTSAQIIGMGEEFDGQIELSEERKITGVLDIKTCTSIHVNDSLFVQALDMFYPEGEILGFSLLGENSVKLEISWNRLEITGIDFTTILIEAREISWRNISDLEKRYNFPPIPKRYLNKDGKPTQLGNADSYLYPSS